MNNQKSTNIRNANLLLEKRFLNELSPKSVGVQDFLQKVKDNDGSLKHLGFKSMKSLEEYISDSNNIDFHELVDELNDYLKDLKKKK